MATSAPRLQADFFSKVFIFACSFFKPKEPTPFNAERNVESFCLLQTKVAHNSKSCRKNTPRDKVLFCHFSEKFRFHFTARVCLTHLLPDSLYSTRDTKQNNNYSGNFCDKRHKREM